MIRNHGTYVALYLFIYFSVFGCTTRLAGILVPRPGMKPGPSARKALSPNHWTAREFPSLTFNELKLKKMYYSVPQLH